MDVAKLHEDPSSGLSRHFTETGNFKPVVVPNGKSPKFTQSREGSPGNRQIYLVDVEIHPRTSESVSTKLHANRKLITGHLHTDLIV